MNKPVIVLTMGDPGGIGPEILQKTCSNKSTLRDCIPLVIGAEEAFRLLEARCGLVLERHRVGDDSSEWREGRINFFDITGEAERLCRRKFDRPLEIEPGLVSPANASLAWVSLEAAVRLAGAGKLHAVVTAPLSKTAIRLLVPGFSGHTEHLAESAGTDRFAMMFVGPRLKVTLATVHVALKEVSASLSTELILDKIVLTDRFLKENFLIPAPSLAVCALNPHGRETGDEEDRIIAPAVEKARGLGIDVRGPFSADQLFYEAYHGRYDALISMYHDQALAPFKMVSFHDGVNLTLGLPYVRTSPDHGTAFDIAYQNKAQAESMAASFALARRLAAPLAGRKA